MLKQRISEDWYFTCDKQEGYTHIDLPHDSVIGQDRTPDSDGRAGNGFYPGVIGRYNHYFMPEAHAKTILHVDGAYMCAEVMLNENHLSTHPHGYAPYLTDLTGALEYGVTNKLQIRTAALQPSARWYSGGGLYRDVYLWTGGEVRIEPWQLFITTEQDEFGALVHAHATVSSDVNGRAEIVTTLYDAEGSEAAKDKAMITVFENGKSESEVFLNVEKPHFWDLDDPYLYLLKTEIYVAGVLTDTTVESFGIRSIEYDADFGFKLNGKVVKMRGGCIHHDHGVLGAADYEDADERKITLLKKAGFNAVRSSHNPPSLNLLETCDRLGMLLMDEAFDMWTIGKCHLDYHLWFEDWWKRDATAMVLRDRNHPCVVSYSIGNEIQERDGRSDGDRWAAKIADQIRAVDGTRPVTAAVCAIWKTLDGSDPEDYQDRLWNKVKAFDGDSNSKKENWWRVSDGYFKPLDIVGYNYLYMEYETDHERFPERVMWGSETHALKIWDSWDVISRSPWVIGDFTWTAYDNLGEAGTGRWAWARDGFIPGISLADYPWRTCYQGDLDLCGYRRPQSYYREIVWGLSSVPKIFTTHPEHYHEGFSGTEWHFYDVHETWTFDSEYLGKPVQTDVYTDADEVEFFLNGKSFGRAKAEKCIATMDIPYAPGTVSVIAYKNGKESGRNELSTTGKAVQIRLTPEETELTADGRNLLYVQIALEDKEGRRVVEEQSLLKAEVKGGKLLGIFSADPKNEDKYGSACCHAFDGRALAVISSKEPGKAVLTVSSEGMESGEATAEFFA